MLYGGVNGWQIKWIENMKKSHKARFSLRKLPVNQNTVLLSIISLKVQHFPFENIAWRPQSLDPNALSRKVPYSCCNGNWHKVYGIRPWNMPLNLSNLPRIGSFNNKHFNEDIIRCFLTSSGQQISWTYLLLLMIGITWWIDLHNSSFLWFITLSNPH